MLFVLVNKLKNTTPNARTRIDEHDGRINLIFSSFFSKLQGTIE